MLGDDVLRGVVPYLDLTTLRVGFCAVSKRFKSVVDAHDTHASCFSVVSRYLAECFREQHVESEEIEEIDTEEEATDTDTDTEEEARYRDERLTIFDPPLKWSESLGVWLHHSLLQVCTTEQSARDLYKTARMLAAMCRIERSSIKRQARAGTSLKGEQCAIGNGSV